MHDILQWHYVITFCWANIGPTFCGKSILQKNSEETMGCVAGLLPFCLHQCNLFNDIMPAWLHCLYGTQTTRLFAWLGMFHMLIDKCFVLFWQVKFMVILWIFHLIEKMSVLNGVYIYSVEKSSSDTLLHVKNS